MTKPTNDDLKWIGIDFDDTIARNSGFPDFTPAGVVEGAKEGLEELVARGYKIIVYTARPSSDVYLVEDWLKQNGMDHLVRRIFTGKELFRYMIDDRAIRHVTWKENLDLIDRLDAGSPYRKQAEPDVNGLVT